MPHCTGDMGRWCGEAVLCLIDATLYRRYGEMCGGAVLCLIDATLYRRYGEMGGGCCIMSYRCHTVQEIWGDGVVGLYYVL